MHVGKWIRCSQALCNLSLPSLPRQEELLADIPCCLPLAPFPNWECWCFLCCSCVPWPGRACWDPPYFQGTWSGSSKQGVKPGCPAGVCWDDGDALTWSLLLSLQVLVTPGGLGVSG